MSGSAEGSIVIRRSIGRQLKELRYTAGKSLNDVAVTRIVSKAKLARMESGQGHVYPRDVIALCHLYEADRSITDQLATMAQTTVRGGWWEDYTRHMSSGFAMYIEMESAAREVWTYSPNLIPGLLQTPDYHRAVFESDPFLVATESLDAQLRLRVERQRRAFDRTPSLGMVAILEEGALRRLVGGKEVMRAQTEHLVGMSRRYGVDIRVLVNEAGAHPGMKGGFNRLHFGADDEPDVIYVETLAGGRYVEQPDQVARFVDVFDLMRTRTTTIEEFI